MLRPILLSFSTLAIGLTMQTQFANAQTKRPIRPGDIYRLPAITDPQPSPDGKWISYTLSTIDSIKDSRNSDIWMISWDGTQDIQLTNSPEGETRARWSPDGKYISFLSSRQPGDPTAKPTGAQVWLLDRRGGEGRRLTDRKGGINDYAWSPDSRKLLLTMTDPDPEDSSKIKTTNPMSSTAITTNRTSKAIAIKKRILTSIYSI